MSGVSVEVDRVSKSFGLHLVLDDLTLRLAAGSVTCLMGPSGTGKTTLLRLVTGLERPDLGRVVGVRPGEVSAVLQEDRLCEMLTPVENVALVHPDRRVSRRRIRQVLTEILPERCLDQPVRELSGGMRRRVSLACAVAYPGRLVVLDEPFTGLDPQTRRTVAGYVRRHRHDRTLLVATHAEEDVALLDAVRVVLPTAAETR
jgi:NitT/TauT family transport system ATP-binding protein